MNISPHMKTRVMADAPWKIPELELTSLHKLSWSIQLLSMSNENLCCRGNYYAFTCNGRSLTWWQPSFWQAWTPSKLAFVLQKNLRPQHCSVLCNILEEFLWGCQSSRTRNTRKYQCFVKSNTNTRHMLHPEHCLHVLWLWVQYSHIKYRLISVCDQLALSPHFIVVCL